MTLKPPFCISARLAPAVKIADSHQTGWLSYDNGRFVIDLPDGSEHVITDYRPGLSARRDLVKQFGDILSFMGACAESRRYARSRGKDEMEGENSDLFPPNVGEFCEAMADELAMLQCEIEESDEALTED